jgi:methionyl-tRNA formyltransferase
VKKIILAGYRDWATSAFSRADVGHMIARSPDELLQYITQVQPDAVFLAGWSWLLPSKLVDSTLCVGVHPSALPEFAGGTPIQHQILAGVQATHATLFRLRSQLDAGEILDQEPIDLRGHLDAVFSSLETATVMLLQRFACALDAGVVQSRPQPVIDQQDMIDRICAADSARDDFWPVQLSANGTLKRLTPQDSRLPWHGLGNASCRQLWDAIRCREDPYPNAYLEDDTGRLTFTRVEFTPKER